MISEPTSNITPSLPVMLTLEVGTSTYRIVLPHAERDYIQKKLVADRKPYEREMLEDLAARVKPGELVLDIGANIGNHTLYLAAVARCRVESFEPNPALCAALRESVKLNGLGESVHVHEAGLGQSAGPARFGNDLPENLGGQHLALGEGDLRVMRLDDVALPGPARVLKIDVEGMELDVLEGGGALIARDRPLLYVECGTEAHYRTIARHLESLNYSYWETFNATPTHLFIPTEQVSLEQRMQHLQAKAAESDYRVQQQVVDTRKALNDVNLKYRGMSEQVGNLKQKLAQEEGVRLQAAARVTELEAQLQARAHELATRTERDVGLKKELDEVVRTARQAELSGVRTDALFQGVREQLDAANLKYRESNQRYAELKERLGQAESARQAAAARSAELQGQLESASRALDTERRERKEQVATLTEQLRERADGAIEAQKALVRSESQLEGLRTQVEGLRGQLDAAAQAVQASQQTLQVDRAAQQARADALAAEARAHGEATHDVQKQLIRTEAVVETVRGQLDAANLKYRESTQRYADLKERFARADTAHRQAAAQLAESQGRLSITSDALQTQATTHREQLQALQKEIAASAEQRQALGKQLGQSEVAGADLRAQLAAATLKYRESSQQYAELQERLQRGEAALHDVSVRLADTEGRLAASVASLASHTTDHAERLAVQAGEAAQHHLAMQLARQQLGQAQATATELRSQLLAAQQALDEERAARQQQTEATHAALQQSQRAEARGDALLAQLDAANLKYRDATQRHAELKDRLALEEAAHAAMKEQVEQQQAAHAALQEQVEQQQAALAALQEQLAQQEAARAAMHEHLAQEQAAHAGAAARLTETVTQLAGAAQALDEARAMHRDQTALLEGELQVRTQAVQAARQQLDAAEAQTVDLRGQLVAADLATRELARQRDTVQAAVDARSAELVAAQGAVSERDSLLEALRDEIDIINLKYREATQRHAVIKDQLRLQESARQAADSSIEQQKIDLLKGRQALARSEREIERLKNQRIAAENQVTKTRAMVSFQVGYAIVHGLKSPRGVLGLPGTLWGIYQKNKARKQFKPDPLLASPAPAFRPAAASVPRLHAASNAAAQGGSVVTLPTVASAQRLKTLRVACIMDEFTYSSYQPECNLLQLTPQHFQQELAGFKPELLFIESAWRGKDELWGSKVGHLAQEVQDILAWCREHKVPTVFWNKEDPIHFETFLTTARQFDHVFTTDIDCIHRYKAALGHERVYLLPFAAQPELSNPIEKYERKDAFCFAGAYYVRYPERTRDLGNFVSQLADFRPVEIYDRNFGKNDPNYQFPPEYQPFIVGNLPFEQIDKAYKGYRFAINLNSIKQSQTMFARRVFELLASNTITVSNYSRGVRLLFGDLVVTTDSGEEINRRLRTLCADDTRARKFRLAGLRKVMSSHTYQDRLAYVVSKVQGLPLESLMPVVAVVGYARNQAQFDALLAAYQRQTHAERRLVIVVPNGFEPDDTTNDPAIQVIAADHLADQTVGEITEAAALVAGMVPDDYYGPNYLRDLALASRYSRAQAFGKASHFVWVAEEGLQLAYTGRAYRKTGELPARCSMARTAFVGEHAMRDWVTGLYVGQLAGAELLSIDEFNYCKNGNHPGIEPSDVDDLPGLNDGISLADLITRAERIAPQEAEADQAPVINGDKLSSYFKPPANRGYTCTLNGPGWEIESSLADGKHEYLYASTDLRPAELGFENEARFHLDITPGLNLQLVILFLDAQKQRISHVVKNANRNQEAPLPVGTEWIRLGLRIYGGGASRINTLVLGHRPLRPAEVLGRADHLVLTNHYPSYDDLYRNGFVHSRVAAYAERGVKVDVFRLRKDEPLSFHEFHDVDVITGSQQALHKLLAAGNYKSVLVHFLDEAMWDVLKHHQDHLKVFTWVHGAEIQPWHRRDYNFENEAERDAAKLQSEERMRFWRGLLKDMPANLQLIFVSRYFAEEVMEDLGFRLPESKYQIIHNPIDTDLFAYQPKPAEQRKKILSIRPYASRKYANDLSVQAILALSKKPWFKDLEFRMIGDGKLFDEVLAPLKDFDNVVIERGFLKQSEIAQLHRSYGIFLCPTRMDAQGVSRDEAMASGLVPVTNGVTAIPEFVDATSGMLAPAEDFESLADGIERLYLSEEVFHSMSQNAGNRVRQQSASKEIVHREMILMNECAR